MKNRRIAWLLLMLLTIPLGLFAQNITVKGVVTDSEGEPIIGASVIEKGKSGNGTITNLDGNFTLNVSGKNKKLVISYIGMTTQEVDAATGKVIKVVLHDDAQALDEVVVIGYGTSKRGDLTGSVASVGAKTLKDIPVTSAASAITGRLAGVNVVTTEGSPDATINIRVRGGGSITQDNSPLFIVDGFQVDNIDDIPPGDIESIDVLKDASSTAIYGAKGANGVILVTTKSGKAGKTEIKFGASVGLSSVYNLYDVLSPYEYVYYQRELDPSNKSGAFFGRYGVWEDIGIYKASEGTDWQEKMFGNTGVQQKYNLSISGGTQDLQYSLSYTHDDETYIMNTSRFKRDNLNLKIKKNINKALKFDFNMKLSKTVIDGPSVSGGKKLRDTVKYPPISTLDGLTEDDLGNNGYEVENISSLNDPYYNIVNEYKQQNKFSNIYNGGFTWDIVKGLSLRAEGMYGFEFEDTDNIWLNNTGEAASNAGQPVAQRQNWKGNRWAVQSRLNYGITFGKNKFDAMVGLEYNHRQKNETKMYSKFYPIDFTAENILAMWNYGSAQPTYTTIGEPSRTNSFLGRVNYSFDDRYLFTFNMRADGTNVFAPGKKWGVFPGGSAAWRISQEKFMENTQDWLSNLKLRLSYGTVGNARVSSYWRQDYSFESASKNLYYPNESVESALKPSKTLRNENLTWETKYSANAGLDIGLFNNRLNVTVDMYKDITKDLILQINLPSNSGYDNQYQNLGQTTNRGIELSLNGTIVDTKDLYIAANFNIAFNRNRVDALDGNSVMIHSSGSSADIGKDDYRVFVGQELGLIYGYVTDGMYSFDDFTYNPETKKWVINEGVPDCSSVITTSGSYFGPGHIKLRKLGGEGTQIDPDVDRTVIGNALPKHTGGFGLNVQWKDFDLAAMFNWSYGNDILNANKIDFTTYAGSKRYQNVSSLMSLENRFTTIDPATGNNIFYGDNANPDLLMELNRNARIWSPIMGQTILTDWAVEDGSFLRFSNLTIGYTLPKIFTRKFGVQNLRVYATGNNLFCWTAYSGQDPEVSTSKSNLSPGIDNSAYPKARSYVFGLDVTF